MAESPPKSRAKTSLALGDAAPWQDLPPELLPRILARLPTNEVPCTARLVCKAAAAALSSPAHTTVRLSQPSPHSEFACRWGAPGAMRPLTLNRRRRLLALTAASGCLRNLAWLADHVGCSFDDSVLKAAAAAGRLDVCRWLLQQGCTGLPVALLAAAGAGQRSTLEALLADPGAQPVPSHIRSGRDFRESLASYAARGGHVGLMDWLLERFEVSSKLPHEKAGWEGWASWVLLSAAAAGCDLATLRRLHPAHQPQIARLEQQQPGTLDDLLGSAASGSTSDWRAKVEWVEVCLGAPLKETACAKAAACPDALERLTWLRARGCPWDSRAVTSAAGAGNVEALSYLLADGCEVDYTAWGAFRAAAEGGHHEALEFLLSRGLTTTNQKSWAVEALSAARGGHLPAVRWMLERQLIELQPRAAGQGIESVLGTMLGAAAEAGNVELLALLLAGGCRWGGRDLHAAAYGGSGEALEWVVAQGCPVQESNDSNDDPYLIAAAHHDWATLACLRRLAVPWRPLTRQGGTFVDALREGYTVPTLRRLLELGCPVDWVHAAAMAYDRDQDVRAWLKEEEERQRTEQGGG